MTSFEIVSIVIAITSLVISVVALVLKLLPSWIPGTSANKYHPKHGLASLGW